MAIAYRGNYLNGRFVRPSRGVEMVSENPGDLLHPIGKAFTAESAVDQAVESAHKAYPKWRALTMAQRAAKLKTFQQLLKKQVPALSALIAREAGKPIWEAQREVERLTVKVDEMISEGARLVKPLSIKVGSGVEGRCLFHPLGVLAVIGPFNFPAHTPGSHIIPALLLGNTVVFKPSEFTPFVGQMLAELFHAARFPAGVFNLVQGGSKIGGRLTQHAGLQGILFTGSSGTGQAIRQAVLKHPDLRLAMEMGGKNAVCVLADADVTLAAQEAATGAYSMAGQRCNATSRIIVHKSQARAFLDVFLRCVDQVKIGYPMDKGILIGPLVSHEAVAKYRKYLRLAREEGFEALVPGKALGIWEKRRGYYVTPSVHLCENPARNKSTHYRMEEIFGPNVAIYIAADEEEMVALNNEVPFGLITAVFTKDRKRFEKLLPQIDTGMINWNRGTVFSSGKLPFGGTKASGSFNPAGLFSPYYCTYPVAVIEDRRPLGKRDLLFS